MALPNFVEWNDSACLGALLALFWIDDVTHPLADFQIVEVIA